MVSSDSLKKKEWKSHQLIFDNKSSNYMHDIWRDVLQAEWAQSCGITFWANCDPAAPNSGLEQMQAEMWNKQVQVVSSNNYDSWSNLNCGGVYLLLFQWL